MNPVPKKQNLFVYNNFDLELFFCREVLKLDSLHYGYWKAGEELNLKNLRRAQTRYTKTLLTLVPKGARSVLDVGCGVGDVARALTKKGLDVVAISPDRNHQQFFDQDSQVRFCNVTFEEFETDDRFDLVLMCESQNYFHAAVGLQQAVKHTKRGSHLLISGMFRKGPGQEFNDVTNIESEYREKAEQHGFRLVKRFDITTQVLPTLRLSREIMERYLEPATRMLGHYLRARSPVPQAILALLLRKQVKDYRKALAYYTERTDAELFEKNVRYLQLLFKRV